MALKDYYFTISEAAKELGVTRQTISRWIADGEIRAEKVGRETLIEKVELRQYRGKKLDQLLHKMMIGLAIDRLRAEYHYTIDDVIEERGYTSDDWIFSVRRSDGSREKILVGEVEAEVELGKKMRFRDLKLRKVKIYKVPRKEQNSPEIKPVGKESV
jgi:excisionase family DNA binding protein